MKKIFLLAACFLIAQPAFAWGFWAHKQINRMAVFTLPSGMSGFYKKHIDFITVQAIAADKRRYVNKDEAPRHYIDLDHYEDRAMPLPERWKDAESLYTEDTLMAYGIVPWYIQLELYSLTEAFKKKDQEQILYFSANIAHYIADAHVPLHTTSNYNGQMTNQQGIHGLWEARVPELLGDTYDYFAGKAVYIENPACAAWDAVKQSHAEVDSVLSAESLLTTSFPRDRKYAWEQKGRKSVKTYSRDFAAAYNEALRDMAERRMEAAIRCVGSFWYTAWINAGQPDLDKIHTKAVIIPEEEPRLDSAAVVKGHME